MSDTPETDAARLVISSDDSSCGIYSHTEDGSEYTGEVCRADRMADLERQRDEARELLASEKSTRNAIIAKGIETERQLAEARAEAARLQMELDASCSAEELRQVREENARLREALQRIADCTDAPDIDPAGEIRFGLHCGVEDCDCTNRYDGADYGFTCGTERALEWAQNEAKHALTP